MGKSIKRSVLAALVLLVSSAPVRAQEGGKVSVKPAVSYGMSKYMGGDLKSSIQYTLKAGLDVGIGISDTWSVQTGLYYISLGNRVDKAIIDGVSGDKINVRQDMLSIPIQAGVHLPIWTDEQGIMFKFGPYVSYGLGGNAKYNSRSYNVYKDLDFRRFDAGLAVNVNFEIGEGYIGLEGRMGLTQVSKVTRLRNNALYLTIGYEMDELLEAVFDGLLGMDWW